MDEEKQKDDRGTPVIDEEERRQEIEDTLKIMAVVVAVGLGLLLMTVVIPWLKSLFAGTLVPALFISLLGIGAYFLSDLLVKKEVVASSMRLTLAKIILLAAVLIGSWLF